MVRCGRIIVLTHREERKLVALHHKQIRMHSWIDVVLSPLTAMGIQFRTGYGLCYVIITTTAITNVVMHLTILVQELGCMAWFVKADSIQPGRLETHLGGGEKKQQ